MTEPSADGVRAEFVQAFPAGTGDLAHELWQSIAHLHLKWKDYRALFGTSPERIDLLNRVAPAFFGYLEPVMRHDVVLAITRLTDPAGSGIRVNASLARLLDVIEPQVDASTIEKWRIQLGELEVATEPLRAIRNRFLAHEDLATALNYHPQPLPGFSRADVESLLLRIRELFGSIEQQFRLSRTSHELIIADAGDQLVAALERAWAHRGCERAEFQRKYGIQLPEE